LFYTLRSLKNLKKGMQAKKGDQAFWQAGKSVQGVTKIESVQEVFATLLSEK